MNSTFISCSIEEQLMNHIEEQVKVFKEWEDLCEIDKNIKDYPYVDIELDSKAEQLIKDYLTKTHNYSRNPFFVKVEGVVKTSYYFDFDTETCLRDFKNSKYFLLVKEIEDGFRSSRKFIAKVQFNTAHVLSSIFKDAN